MEGLNKKEKVRMFMDNSVVIVGGGHITALNGNGKKYNQNKKYVY